jgi:DNA-directed RNA polymerase subunit RPC12/RpoP
MVAVAKEQDIFEGGRIMEDVQFVCAACEKTYTGDEKSALTECRVCGRLHCKGCVDEYGRCVECAEKEPSKKK